MNAKVQATHPTRWMIYLIILPLLTSLAASFPSLLVAQSQLTSTELISESSDSHKYISGLNISDENLVKLSKRISLDFDNTSVRRVLQYIAGQAKLKLSFNWSTGDLSQPVSIKAEGITALEALFETIKNTNLSFKLTTLGHLIVSESSKPQVDQIVTRPPAFHLVNGVVTSGDDNQPLPGVNILVKGTLVGATTNEEGEYSINAPSPSDTLMFSFVGYQTQTIPINGQQTINVSLAPDVLEADELIVVAYGVQRKSDVTGSVASVSTEDFNQGVVVNPGQLLQGVVPGVNVTTASGEPGASQDIIIRGVGSLRSGTTPLYVLDGFVLDNTSIGVANNPLNFMNPGDIQSIEVLKDASATALYGARAANGVVVITSKKGQAGATKVNISSSLGWTSMAKQIDVFSASEFRRQVPSVGGQLDDLGADTDWQDQLTQTALSSDINFSMSGAANDRFNYYASLGVQNQEGILKESNLSRYSGRLNLSQTAMNGKLKVDYHINAVHSANLRPDNTAMVVDMLQLNPTIPVYSDGAPTQLDEILNPVVRYDLYLDESLNNRFVANVAPSLEIVDGLTYRLNVGRDYSATDREVQTSPYALLEGFERGTLRSFNYKNTNTLVENTLTYFLDSNAHAVNLLAGHSYQENLIEVSSLEMEGFRDNGIEPRYQDQISTQITPTNRSANAQKNKLQSFFGRLNYSYDGKYLFTATMRADGSSKFGENNRYGYFPSFALGWNISKESFLNNSVFNNLKLRASWGQTGIQEIPSKITQLSYTESRGGSNTYPLDPGASNLDDYPFGIIFTRLANPNIQWEVSTQTDVGIDFGLFEDRLVGTLDYYHKVSDNILLEVVPSDPIQPTATFWTNIPNMAIKNSGVELALEYRSALTSTLQYSIGGNISTIKNRVENSPYAVLTTGSALGAGQTGATINGYINGEPIGSFYMLEFAGIGDDGLNQFADTNNDGAILEDDRVVVGSALPNLLYGVQVSLQYKNVGLRANFNGASGHSIYNHTAMTIFNKGNLGSNFNTTEFATEYPEEALTNSNTVSTRYLEDGSYLRLNNVTLSYSLKPELLGIGSMISGLQLSLTAQNPFIITGYSGYDPEVNTGSSRGGVQTFGIDRFTYPTGRTFQLGMNMTF